MAKAKKVAVKEKKHKVQKAPKIKVVPKVQKKVPEVKKVEAKKVQPKIVQPKDKKVKPKVEKAKPEIIQPKKQEAEWVIGVDPYGKRYGGENPTLDVPDFSPMPFISSKSTDVIIKNIPIEVKIKDEQQLNVSEMTIIEIMHQKNISWEGAIEFIRTNQNKK